MGQTDISVGDVVVAVKPGGCDHAGRPTQRPVVGKHYRVTSIYGMNYGLGCTLQGLDPAPYKGYFLHVKRETPTREKGWYFRKVEAADPEWTTTLYELLRSKKHEERT